MVFFPFLCIKLHQFQGVLVKNLKVQVYSFSFCKKIFLLRTVLTCLATKKAEPPRDYDAKDLHHQSVSISIIISQYHQPPSNYHRYHHQHNRPHHHHEGFIQHVTAVHKTFIIMVSIITTILMI